MGLPQNVFNSTAWVYSSINALAVALPASHSYCAAGDQVLKINTFHAIKSNFLYKFEKK